MSSRKTRRKRSGEAIAKADEPKAVWPGVVGGRFRPLTEAEELAAHETVLQLLETVGISQAIPSMVERVVARGGTYTDDKRLLFPRDLVEEVIANSRRDIILYGQSPGQELDISGARVHMGSGGASPNIVDLTNGRYREATTQDLYDAARIVDQMENIHMFSRSMVARDTTSMHHLDVNTAYSCLSGTDKHVCVSISDPANVAAVADICYTLAGGERAFRDKPFLTIMVCHVVPPMRFAEEACETIENAVRAGFPIQLISAGQAGATSPATLAGSLVQAVAETLAGMVHAYLVDSQTQSVFAPKPLVADLRTGAMCGGGGEQAILMAAAAQMGRYYDLPTSSIAGITDAKIPDAQHGSEKCLAVTLAAQAGSNIVTQSCGMQASLLGCSLESYVVDNDMLGNILRSIRGMEMTRENMAADVIADVTRGEGHYLGHHQTLERMKIDYAYPEISDRRSPSDWFEDGAKDARTRAIERAREILASHFPRHIADDIDEQLRRRYDIVLSRASVGRAA